MGSPPRMVPLGVKARVLFGSTSSQLGWVFLGVGMVVSMLILSNIDRSASTFRRNIVECKGRVTKVEETNYSEGGGGRLRDHGTPVYRICFNYSGDNGVKGEGVSYALGDQVEEGEEVCVEYLRDKPQVARIQGMRTGMVSSAGVMVILMPIVGAAFVCFGGISGLRNISLLSNGIQELGTLVHKKRTRAKIGEQTVYRLTFEFKANDDQTYFVRARTHEPKKLEDEKRERLLYDPWGPKRAVMLDALPGSPHIGKDGSMRAGSLGGLIGVLSIPAVAIIGNIVFICFYYLR